MNITDDDNATTWHDIADQLTSKQVRRFEQFESIENTAAALGAERSVGEQRARTKRAWLCVRGRLSLAIPRRSDQITASDDGEQLLPRGRPDDPIWCDVLSILVVDDGLPG